MPDMTRDEHLAWCKERARPYLDQRSAQDAVASMMSDLKKHPETADIPTGIVMIGLWAATRGDVEEARRFIEGFN